MVEFESSARPSRRSERAAVFLDRDGVLNRAMVRGGRPYPPGNLDEVELLSGVEAACGTLKAAGLLLIVVTNQPDIARGKVTAEGVDAINVALGRCLPLDDIVVCPHDDADECACRKPKPGLLLAAAEKHGIDLTRSVMVGDRWRDIAAGSSAGCRTVFVDCHYDEAQPAQPDHVTTSLAASVPFIIAATRTAKE